MKETDDMTSKLIQPLALAGPLMLMVAACTPTVKVAAPTEPITINLNVKIDGDVRVRLDKEVDDLIADNPDLF
jgi:hypothetical protein